MSLKDYIRANPNATDEQVVAYGNAYTIAFAETWITERTLVGKFGLSVMEAAALVFQLYRLGTADGNPDPKQGEGESADDYAKRMTDKAVERYAFAQMHARLTGDGLDIGTAGSHATLDMLAGIMPDAVPLMDALKAASSRRVYPFGQEITTEQVAEARRIVGVEDRAREAIEQIKHEANAGIAAWEAWRDGGGLTEEPA